MSPSPRWDGLSCHQVIEYLLAFLADELAPPVRAEMDRHIAVCPSCQAYLASYRDTLALARGSCDGEELLASAPDELVVAILAARSTAGE